MSYLPQEASVFRKLSVEDNIRAILEMQVDENGRALDTSEIEHRLEMLLDELQIKHLRTNAAPLAANAAAQKSPVPLQLILGSFSWMNPSLVLIRLP